MASTKLYGPSSSPVVAGDVIAASTQAGNAAPLPALQSVTGTGAVTIKNPANTAKTLTVAIPVNSPLEQKEFTLRASGYVTTDTTANVTIEAKIGTSTTAASNTALASSGAVSVATATMPWFIEARLVFDSVSGKITGVYEAVLGGTRVAPTIITSGPISQSINNASTTQGAAVVSFSLAVTFSAVTTANAINVAAFEIDF